ncbi:MAG: C_GCAxxG_C_C family protein, partial [Nitrospirae bacterium]|nr:C_GCAxxG_C_C family protein [Nitrospirota bacterium]
MFGAYGDKLRFDKETVLKIASPFGGGIGRMGETCGAVTGALMVIGLKYGRFK